MLRIIISIYWKLKNRFDFLYTKLLFRTYKVSYSSFRTNGVPLITIGRLNATMEIGKGFAMNNGIQGNRIGCYERCTFVVNNNCKLQIGENFGISQSAIICCADVYIGNNVKIGGGCQIITSDFHSLDPEIRKSKEDAKNKKNAPIIINDNVFIGTRSIILKGVSIGANSIVAAGSIVTKPIPPNQIWGGNPAKFIKNIHNDYNKNLQFN